MLSDYGMTKYRVDYLKNRGYTEEIEIHGTVGYTGLAMHMCIAETKGIVAFVRPNYPWYAIVLLETGSIAEGCFHLRADGTFTIS